MLGERLRSLWRTGGNIKGRQRAAWNLNFTELKLVLLCLPNLSLSDWLQLGSVLRSFQNFVINIINTQRKQRGAWGGGEKRAYSLFFFLFVSVSLLFRWSLSRFSPFKVFLSKFVLQPDSHKHTHAHNGKSCCIACQDENWFHFLSLALGALIQG